MCCSPNLMGGLIPRGLAWEDPQEKAVGTFPCNSVYAAVRLCLSVS